MVEKRQDPRPQDRGPRHAENGVAALATEVAVSGRTAPPYDFSGSREAVPPRLGALVGRGQIGSVCRDPQASSPAEPMAARGPLPTRSGPMLDALRGQQPPSPSNRRP